MPMPVNNDEPVVVSKTKNAAPHCSARTASGRRCRMAVSDPESGLCLKHAALQKKDRDTANVAAKLIGDTEEFTSAVTINHSLGELYKLLARDEISPRRGAVMAYTCSLLLRTLPAIDDELNPPDEEPQIILDLPRPKRDDDISPERAMVNRWSAPCSVAHAGEADPPTISGSPVESPK